MLFSNLGQDEPITLERHCYRIYLKTIENRTKLFLIGLNISEWRESWNAPSFFNFL